MAKRSPPMPFIMGSETLRTALAAMAASTAEPPCSSTRAPACEAWTQAVATMPYCEETTERPYERSCATSEAAVNRDRRAMRAWRDAVKRCLLVGGSPQYQRAQRAPQ